MRGTFQSAVLVDATIVVRKGASYDAGMKRVILATICLAWFLAAQGCRTNTGLEAGRQDAAGAVRQFEVKGVIKSLSPSNKTVTIQHEPVEDYMPAMTMPFSVQREDALAGLAPGDAVEFRLLVTEEDHWIENIRRVAGESPSLELTNELPRTGSFRLAPEVELLEEGDLLPNYSFTNQLGQKVNLHDFRGKAVALTFIFTRCPIPDFCPRMSQNFAVVYKQLQEAPVENWHLLSLSFDPGYDTPEVLQRYADRFSHDPAHWSYLTGAISEIDAIAEQLGVVFTRVAENMDWTHNLRTVVIGPDGRLRKIFPGNQWRPEQVSRAMIEAATESP